MKSNELRKELLELESFSPDLQARYREEMKSLLVRPLGGAGRIGYQGWPAPARTHTVIQRP